MEIAFLPSTVQEMIRGLNYYDPRFGTAFYDGTWNAGFDHAEALQKIYAIYRTYGIYKNHPSFWDY